MIEVDRGLIPGDLNWQGLLLEGYASISISNLILENQQVFSGLDQVFFLHLNRLFLLFLDWVQPIFENQSREGSVNYETIA